MNSEREELKQLYIVRVHRMMGSRPSDAELVEVEANAFMEAIDTYVESQKRKAKIEAAKYIQGNLLADEPEVIASNRSEDVDNTWFKAQLAFSNYIDEEVIEPYIVELQASLNTKQEGK